MTAPPFVPSTGPSDPRPDVPRMSPNATAIIAGVEALRLQLRALEAGLDTIVALVHAGEYSRATMANVLRDRAARETRQDGLPPVFGARPPGFGSPSPASSSMEFHHDESSSNTGDALERIDGDR